MQRQTEKDCLPSLAKLQRNSFFLFFYFLSFVPIPDSCLNPISE
jgi:hypothetical protein